MSIPRAKITKFSPRMWRGLWVASCDGCGLEVWGTFDWREAVREAHTHLRDVHGVRTVGSLTAADVGKWVEIDGREPFQIANVYHGRTMTGVGNGCLSGPWLPSSTLCRVTEAKP